MPGDDTGAAAAATASVASATTSWVGVDVSAGDKPVTVLVLPTG